MFTSPLTGATLEKKMFKTKQKQQEKTNKQQFAPPRSKSFFLGVAPIFGKI